MKRFLWMVLTGWLLAGSLPAQPADLPFAKDEDIPDFFYDATTSASPDSGKAALSVHVKILYDEFQFLRDSAGYKARYELSATVFDQKGEQTDGRILEKEIAVNTFAETNSRKDFSVSEILLHVLPGNYELRLGVMDLDSKKTGRRKAKITVPSYGGSALTVSDIVILDQIRSDSLGVKTYLPNVTGNYAEKQDSLYFLFQAYHVDYQSPLKIAWSILDMAGKTVRKNEMQKMLKPDENTLVIKLPKENLKSGKYRLSLTVENGKSKITKSKEVSVHWAGMPVFMTDLEHAIDQLRYIAKGGEIKKLKKAKGDEKQKLFEEFWLKLDPTPGTELNELMEEYYRRVEYANSNFSAFQQGWQSDRGMVFIILGPPNDIERHPFESNSKPYEIWSYYSLNRNFIFIDTTGFGDYRLSSGTPFWDLIGHLR